MKTTEDKNAGMKSEKEDGCSRRSIFNSLPLFIFNISSIFLFAMIGVVYLGGVARTMERRFGLRSSQTGFLFSCDNISSIIVVLFIGYVARRGHKPRIISVTILFTAVAFLMMSTPHFLFDSSPVPLAATVTVGDGRAFTGSNASSAPRLSALFCPASSFPTTGSSDDYNMCNATFSSETSRNSSTSMAADGYVHPAYYIFATAQFIGGVGTAGMGALGFSYIDENAPKTKTSLYMGIITSTFQLGPVLGYMLSAFTLRLPENLLTPSTTKPEDPTFIGCWWLGYLICGVAVVLLAIPMWFFPKSMATAIPASDDEKETIKTTEIEEKRNESLLEKIKEFPRCLVRLFCNSMYMLMIGSSLTVSYLIMGINVNMVRYIEIHFFERAFVGSLIASVVLSMASAIGTLFSGVIMTRLKLGLVGGIRIMIMAASCTAVGLFIMFFISCPQLEMAGDVNPTSATLNVLNECNRHCNCPSDRTSFVPVCGSDKKTYFSACFAGCDDFINETYVSCACVGNNSMSFIKTKTELVSTPDSFGTAQHGLCIPECNRLIPFAIVSFLTFTMGAFAVVPTTIVYLRSVDDIDRPFALAFSKFFVDVFGFMPAPIIFGRLIDSSCRMWQRTAAIPSSTWFTGCTPPDFTSDETGSCLLYDTAKVRRLMFGTTFGFKICELILLVFLNMVIKKMKILPDDKDVRVAVQQTEIIGKSAYADDEKGESVKLKQIGTYDTPSDDHEYIAINGGKLERT